mmetsp:Transcript_5111/g.14268  ORF Transcript_5111/g.14268 Transcript_5111/m.14268 type:complete len:242 (-) Transcript_5111:859-1584(-)
MAATAATEVTAAAMTATVATTATAAAMAATPTAGTASMTAATATTVTAATIAVTAMMTAREDAAAAARPPVAARPSGVTIPLAALAPSQGGTMLVTTTGMMIAQMTAGRRAAAQTLAQTELMSLLKGMMPTCHPRAAMMTVATGMIDCLQLRCPILHMSPLCQVGVRQQRLGQSAPGSSTPPMFSCLGHKRRWGLLVLPVPGLGENRDITLTGTWLPFASHLCSSSVTLSLHAIDASASHM